MDQPYLGHKAPRPGRERLSWCPACWTSDGPSAPLSSRHSFSVISLDDDVKLRHVLESCSAVEGTRVALGIRRFLDGCLQAGRSRASAYRHYVLGLDKNGDRIDLAIHLERGASLYKLTETWLNVWEDPGDSVLL